MKQVQSFPKSDRLLNSSQFTRVLRRGKGAADGTLVVHLLRSPHSDRSRLGVTIPKKTGNAVVRNRWKRLIREAFRTQRDQIPNGYDIVARPKKNASPSWRQVRKSLPKLTQKIAGRE